MVHGLRRLRDEAAPGDAAPRPLAREDRDVHGRPRVARRLAGRRVAAADPARPARPARRARAGRRWRPRSSSSSSSATPTRRRSTRATRTWCPATSTTSTTRSSAPRGSSRCSGRIRREMAAAGLEVENSKGECNFGQHEINFTYEDALGAADTHVIYKNGAKEIASQEGMAHHVHGQVRRARGQLVPRPPVAARRGRHAGVRRRARAVRPLPGRAARLHARPDAVPGPEHQLLQALRGGLVRPHRGRLGPRQPHVLDAGHRPRAVAADGEPRRRRRRQPLPRDRGDDRRRACTGSTTSSSSSRRSRATRTPPTSRTCRARSRRRATCSRASDVAREAFGEDVVAHYLNNADVELRAFEAAVTDWERFAGLRAAVTLTVLEPATEEVLAEIPRAGAEEADAAVARAKAALPGLAGGRARRPLRAAAPARRRARGRARGAGACSRRATPASRSATRAARWGWWSTPSATTRPGRSATSATRSRWRAASA